MNNAFWDVMPWSLSVDTTVVDTFRLQFQKET